MNEATQPREGMRALATDRQAAAGPRVHWRAPVRDRIHRAARRGYPHEVCGLLLGRHLDDGVLVERAVRVPNRSPDRRADRYVLDPLGFLRFERLAEGRGLEVVGIWHTHPDSP
ncbi:MAG: M67 family metallopeptidase, partial [Acidobacteriota bacterium]